MATEITLPLAYQDSLNVKEAVTQAAVAPVTAQERIESVDALRGVALLGILLMNIIGFGLPMNAYHDPTIAGGHTGLNLVFWYANQIIFEGKMRALFSMLFGAGVVLLTQRAEERDGGLRVADIYYRRTLWLIVFGLLHAYFIWIGDILYAYGVAGLMLFPLRRVRPAALLAAGVVLLIMLGSKGAWEHYNLLQIRDRALAADRVVAAGGQPTEEQRAAQKIWEEKQKEIKPGPTELAMEIKPHRAGYWELFKWRMEKVVGFQTIMFYRFGFYDVAGMMLIGMALLKLGIITAGRGRKFYLWMILFGFGMGGTIHALIWHYYASSGFTPPFSRTITIAIFLSYDTGRLLVASGHIGLVMLIVKSGWLKRLTSRLAAVGQMALTCYLTTSLICTTIFEGYGFGLFAKLQRYQLLYVTFSVWMLLLIVSPIWLRYFRFGPMEWVWRSLTYWRWQPMKIAVQDQSPQPLATTSA